MNILLEKTIHQEEKILICLKVQILARVLSMTRITSI